jgi:hypothetical protein
MTGLTGIARLYFLDGDGNEAKQADTLATVVIIALDTHVNNVKTLVEAWGEADRRDSERTDDTRWDEVVFAAAMHDYSKPDRFSVTWTPTTKDSGKGEFGYSFSGHRFTVPPSKTEGRRYAAALIREHHTFGTREVIDATGKLMDYDAEGNPGILTHDNASLFAHDLYVLEVCDNIAADIETWTAKGELGKDRDFVECTVLPRDETSLRVEPWPFIGDILTLERGVLRVDVDEELRRTLEADVKKAKEGKLIDFRKALEERVASANDAKWERKEVTLWKT